MGFSPQYRLARQSVKSLAFMSIPVFQISQPTPPPTGGFVCKTTARQGVDNPAVVARLSFFLYIASFPAKLYHYHRPAQESASRPERRPSGLSSPHRQPIWTPVSYHTGRPNFQPPDAGRPASPLLRTAGPPLTGSAAARYTGCDFGHPTEMAIIRRFRSTPFEATWRRCADTDTGEGQ